MSIPSFPPRAEDTLKSDSAGIPGAVEIRNMVSVSGRLSYQTASGVSVQVGLPSVVALTYAATLNTDASAGDIFDVTLTGNATFNDSSFNDGEVTGTVTDNT